MLYRLITQRKRVRRIRKICNVLFPGYTMYKTDGWWKSTPEKSLVIEVHSRGLPYAGLRVQTAAQRIRDLNGQECVLVQSLNCGACFV